MGCKGKKKGGGKKGKRLEQSVFLRSFASLTLEGKL